MKKSNGYKIEYATKVIIITRKFAKAAGVLGSPEFKIMQQLRAEFPDFDFQYKTIEKNDSKNTYKNLTVDEMKKYLATREDSKVTLSEFEKVRKLTENKQGKYALIKKWFLGRYKNDYNDYLSLDIEKELEQLEKEAKKEAEDLEKEVA